ncbi:MAG: nucleotide-binding protein [Opitutaceae bacterium]
MPTTTEEQYAELIRRAEKYIRNPRRSKASAVLSWRGAAMRWLKQNVPRSGLSVDFVTTSPPADQSYGEGITRSTVIGVQKGLLVLHQAAELLPALKSAGPAPKLTPQTLNKVFIVHGHDDLMKTTTARFIEKLGLEPIILHEQPNGGRTIIEKFLEYSDVGFAIVLLAGDDKGGLASASPESFRLRARQNVIFELGYFIARLGRSRVVALHQEGVEIPSDYSGVLFVSFDKGGIWQLQIAKEMRASGLKVDMNKI